MKKLLMFLILGAVLTACQNNGSNKTTTDSSTINTNTGNVSDGGPNNGAGDTNDFSRMNDIVKDSVGKDTVPKK